jgi:hypothetical protein
MVAPYKHGQHLYYLLGQVLDFQNQGEVFGELTQRWGSARTATEPDQRNLLFTPFHPLHCRHFFHHGVGRTRYQGVQVSIRPVGVELRSDHNQPLTSRITKAFPIQQ